MESDERGIHAAWGLCQGNRGVFNRSARVEIIKYRTHFLITNPKNCRQSGRQAVRIVCLRVEISANVSLALLKDRFMKCLFVGGCLILFASLCPLIASDKPLPPQEAPKKMTLPEEIKATLFPS